MSVKNVLKELDIVLSVDEFKKLEREAKSFIELIKKSIVKGKIDADVFLGGSFAKGTVAKSKEYDVDIFVRFDRKYDELSERLKKILENVIKETRLESARVHGSRDYFKVFKSRDFTFEVIPVKRIKKPSEAENVTDLSYFHVKYVKSRMKKSSAREIALAKNFFKSAGVYGAESYIHGFSGYGVECLILYYGSFEKMLRELVKVREKIILDPAKHYKKKENVLFEMNEGKLHSPVILIDPTWKERNVLASLNWETFEKFQKRGREFLMKPSKEYFEVQELNLGRLKKMKGEFLHLVFETDRQEGDIAGTKMKKFSKFLERYVGQYFELLASEFVYSGEGQRADFYVVLKPRKNILLIGPPLDKIKDVKRFRAKHKRNVFERDGHLYAKNVMNFSGKDFLNKMIRKDKDVIESMGISKIRID